MSKNRVLIAMVCMILTVGCGKKEEDVETKDIFKNDSDKLITIEGDILTSKLADSVYTIEIDQDGDNETDFETIINRKTIKDYDMKFRVDSFVRLSMDEETNIAYEIIKYSDIYEREIECTILKKSNDNLIVDYRGEELTLTYDKLFPYEDKKGLIEKTRVILLIEEKPEEEVKLIKFISRI